MYRFFQRTFFFIVIGLISTNVRGQIFRTFFPVQPLRVLQNTSDTSKYATLVKRNYTNGNVKYYFLSSDFEGNIKNVPFRYGNIYADTTNLVLPTNFVAVTNCGFTDGLIIGTWNVANKPIAIRRFNDKWWAVQWVDQTPSIDAFQPRGKNFITRNDVTISYPSILNQNCLNRLGNLNTGLDGLYITPNFTTPSGYEVVGDGDIWQKKQTTPPVLATETFISEPAENNYSIASQSWVVSERNMDLELFESNGSLFLRDKATFNKRTDTERRYWINFFEDFFDSYTYSQLQAGINVDAYKGKQITVVKGYHPPTGQYWQRRRYEDAVFQQVYIHSNISTETYNTGTYYYKIPTQTAGLNDRSFRFNEYYTQQIVPNGKDVVIDAYNLSEHNSGNTYANNNILSRKNTGNKKSVFINDDWLYNLGHPYAYPLDWSPEGQEQFVQNFNNWYDGKINEFGGGEQGYQGFKQQCLNMFNSVVIQQNQNAAYVMINNEIKWAWQYPNARQGMWQIYKECIDLWDNNFAGDASAWLASPVFTKYSDKYNMNKTQAYNEYTANLTLAQKVAQQNSETDFCLMDNSSYAAELNVGSIGNYANNLSDYTFEMITDALYAKKFNVPQKLVATIWNTVENLGWPNIGVSQYHNNRPIKFKNVKLPYSGHLMFNYFAAAAFFADGVHMWHDGYTIDNNSPYIYPAFNDGGNAEWLDTSPPTPVTNLYGDAIKRSYMHENNVDFGVNGLWAVYQHTNFLDLPIFIADNNDGTGWRTGADAFVVGAAVDEKPFVAYKRYNNEYLVYAIWAKNKSVVDIDIRMKDANNNDVVKTIKLKADNASIIKF